MHANARAPQLSADLHSQQPRRSRGFRNSGSSRSSWLLATTFAGAFVAGVAGCGHEETASGAITPETPAAGVNCPVRGALVAPSMPGSITPPAGSQLFLRVYAEGAQVYTCQTPASGGAPAWTLKAPDAKLYDDRCVFVGTHFAGPTWKVEKDGSAVVGKKAAEVAAELPGAIPWLLLSTTMTSGAGMLAPVAYINRIDTVGGVAPAGGCYTGSVGTEVKVPYTATYLYYR